MLNGLRFSTRVDAASAFRLGTVSATNSLNVDIPTHNDLPDQIGLYLMTIAMLAYVTIYETSAI